MNLNVALIPSNQIHNRASMAPFNELYNEHGGMHHFAALLETTCKAKGINAQAFPVTAENVPGQTYDHQWIAEAIDRANLWLRSKGGGLMLHFHTDSGMASHTYGIYAGTKWPSSEGLADLLGRKVHEALATETYKTIQRAGSIDYNGYLFATRAQYIPCLLELCSHQSERDMKSLWSHDKHAAAAIADGLLEYAGQGAVDWKARYEQECTRNAELAAALTRTRATVHDAIERLRAV